MEAICEYQVPGDNEFWNIMEYFTLNVELPLESAFEHFSGVFHVHKKTVHFFIAFIGLQLQISGIQKQL